MLHLLRAGAMALALLLCAPALAQSPPAKVTMDDGTVRLTTPSPSLCWNAAAWVGCSADSAPIAVPSFQDRLLREGDPISTSSFGTSVGVTSGAQAGSGVIVATITPAAVAKVTWIEELTVSASTLGIYQVLLNSDASNRFTSFTKQMILGPGLPATIPVRQLYRGFQIASGSFTIAIRNNLSGAAADVTAAISVSGWALTDDFDYSAKNTILWAGDSTANGTAYTSTAKSRMAITRDYFRAQGTTARMLLKSRSGSTTGDHELWRRGGWYDVPQGDIAFYDLGINDAGTGVAVGTATTAGSYVGNVAAFWQWWHARYPTRRMVVLGVAPLENATSEASAASYRTGAAAYVASVASPLLTYINTGDAFDRLAGTAFYAATDTAGSRVHRNDAGEAAIAAKITAGLAAQGITLP